METNVVLVCQNNTLQKVTQVKRSVVISDKLVYNELPHELSNDLRLRILGKIRKYQENLKIS